MKVPQVATDRLDHTSHMWVYPYLLQIKIQYPIYTQKDEISDLPIKYLILVAKLGCLMLPHWMMPPSLYTKIRIFMDMSSKMGDTLMYGDFEMEHI